MPEEFPAVTWPSGPVSDGSAASFSGVVSRRGCSSTLTVDRLAPARRHGHRHDLLGEAAVVGGGHGPDVASGTTSRRTPRG